MPTPCFAARLAIASSSMFFATAALAHPELLSSSPQHQSQGPAPAAIELKFSETLTPQFSSANLVMTGMPGMPGHGEMKVGASVSGASDGKTLVITPAARLMPGSYRVDWRAVSADTHPITGKISFQVQ